MSLEVKIPSVGESVSEVTLGQWLKEDGASVSMDEPICELESDKASFEVNAEAEGILSHKVKEGDTLQVGDLIAVIDTDAGEGETDNDKKKDKKETKEPAEEQEDDKAEKKDKEEKKTEPETASKSSSKEKSKKKDQGEVVEMTVPEVGESITEVTIGQWLKKDGDQVAMDEAIAEIESDKATFELSAEAAGILEIVAKEGETLEIGALLCKIKAGDGEAEGAAPISNDNDDSKGEAEESEDEENTEDSSVKGHASPAAAKILAEKGIKAEELKGSGKDGRITKEDALNAAEKKKQDAERKQQIEEDGKEGVRSQKVFQKSGAEADRGERRERMSTLRKTISRRLVSVKNETAMLTTFNEVNMKPIMDIRKKYKDAFKEKYEIGLGFMSFFAKACCMALSEWPSVNAKIDGDEMIFHEYCDISIAVSTPKGLVVPVVKNVDQMSFDAVEKEIIRLATRARDGKLSIDEMQGGTFTITNGGVFGSMLSTPIINAPQSAILGMHNIVERPVVENGEIVVRPIMYVALSYDHRIVDGRESVSFLVRVKELLEDPTRLLLGI
jgi:2-oxoglutarate dehydrogenase E2 component (dihydrolipoamide succinyltransferase)